MAKRSILTIMFGMAIGPGGVRQQLDPLGMSQLQSGRRRTSTETARRARTS
ncbi:MAG TPA: hypothetical protein VLM79_24950 [Kofleriaceae bacterium]|nr:hypothetical protein [Kofleriaceae bacterium]